MKVYLAPFTLLVILLLIWEIAVSLLQVNPLLLPQPSSIAIAFSENPTRLLRDTGLTMSEAILGFLLGSTLAYISAVIFILSNTTRMAVYPFAVALKSTPLIAIAPLLVLWLGNGMLSKVAMSAVICFFPVLVNVVAGLGSVDRESLDLFRSLSASHLQIMFRLRIPASAPYLFSSLRVASSLAVVGAVIGEYTGSTAGIGHLINTSSYYLQTPLMFAGIISISTGGVIFFGLIALLERKILFWHHPKHI